MEPMVKTGRGAGWAGRYQRPLVNATSSGKDTKPATDGGQGPPYTGAREAPVPGPRTHRAGSVKDPDNLRSLL